MLNYSLCIYQKAGDRRRHFFHNDDDVANLIFQQKLSFKDVQTEHKYTHIRIQPSEYFIQG